jgi:hypothetical protein
MEEFNNYGSVGYYKNGSGVISFQLGEQMPARSETGVIDMDQFNTLSAPIILNVGNNNVLIKGTNNKLPDEITSVISNNRILPTLLEKQVTMLYGKGPHVYKMQHRDGKPIRSWTQQPVIEGWMDNWKYKGLQDSVKEFCEKVIRDNYYFDDFWVKWRLNKSRRINGNVPVAGLEHIDNRRCRLATKKNIRAVGADYEEKDFQTVIVGNWTAAMEKTFKVYKRFRYDNPNQFNVSVSYHKNATPGQIYGYNRFYFGIKDWLIGTNRNPQYINSYLENSLNAKVHVVIPSEWVEMIERRIHQYCDDNKVRQSESKELLKFPDADGIEVGTEYHEYLKDKYIRYELRRLSRLLTGVKNQGKLWASFSFQTKEGRTEWEIKPIDLKYKEFIESLINYDKRADEVITASKGVNSSISNLDKSGIISKSGSDLYYNYIIYLHNLTLAEETVTEPLNTAIRINFPQLYRQGFRIGLYNEVPSRQEEVSVDDRLQNTVNNTVQDMQKQISDQMEQQAQLINELKDRIENGS